MKNVTNLKSSLDAVWRKHRPFLVQVAGGAALYLILVWMASGYADVRAEIDDNDARAANLVQRYANLNLNYWRTVGRKSALEKELADLIADVSIRTESGIKPPSGDLGVEFRTRKDEVYTEFADRANRVGLRAPAQKEISFDEGSDLTQDEWIDRFRQLEVFRRVLVECVGPEIWEIEAIRPGTVVTEAIPGAKELALYRYPVRFDMVLGYRACLGLLQAFQQDCKFLGVEIVELKPADERGAGRLRASIDFVGLDLGVARPDKTGPSGTRPKRKR